MFKGYLFWIPAIRWQIPASGCGWPLFRKKLAGIPKDTQGWNGWFPSSRQGKITTGGIQSAYVMVCKISFS
jgi:hypothetical protein